MYCLNERYGISLFFRGEKFRDRNFIFLKLKDLFVERYKIRLLRIEVPFVFFYLIQCCPKFWEKRKTNVSANSISNIRQFRPRHVLKKKKKKTQKVSDFPPYLLKLAAQSTEQNIRLSLSSLTTEVLQKK